MDEQKQNLPPSAEARADSPETASHALMRLHAEAVSVIQQALNVPAEAITNLSVLKTGMTNRSFLFSVNGKRYIIRIPGEGTDCLINRAQEASVYEVLSGRHICDDVVYFSRENGYKITEFLENAHNCDPLKPEEVKLCMEKLRAFHALKLTVGHEFDLWGQLEYYETLWEGKPSVYQDYVETKANVLSLRPWLDTQPKAWGLTHIDAVPDNFLIYEGSSAGYPADQTNEVRLIDWEYAGMQDQHVDLAMFCIYAFYDRAQVDGLIDLYFPEGCADAVRLKIYAYIAVCGLLWSNWCEYKRSLGVEFGEYALRQYQYAREYYQLVRAHLPEETGHV